MIFSQTKPNSVFQDTPCLSLQCVVDEIQVQQPTLIFATDQMPDHTSAQIAILQITSSGRSLMYSRKIVGPKMEPWRTSALTGYSCEDFQFRTTRIHLLLRKDEIRPNICLKLHKAYVCEKDQHVKPCWKSWIYQALQSEQRQNC